MKKKIILAGSALALTAGSIFAFDKTKQETAPAKSLTEQCPPECCNGTGGSCGPEGCEGN